MKFPFSCFAYLTKLVEVLGYPANDLDPDSRSFAIDPDFAMLLGLDSQAERMEACRDGEAIEHASDLTLFESTKVGVEGVPELGEVANANVLDQELYQECELSEERL